MVLIISNNTDISTLHVIEWLEYLNIKWFRINAQDKISLKFIKNDIEIVKKNKSYKVSNITSVWYRRGEISVDYFNISNLSYDANIEPALVSFLEKEAHDLKNYFHFILTQKKTLNTIFNGSVNKLIVSELAEKNKLLVPKSYLIDTKEEFNKIEEKLITKTICGNPSISFKDSNAIMYTTKIESIEHDSFYPSLFQEQILKKYELRVFYLNGRFYSMAIFSQKNVQTQVDFRQYDLDKPNRTVPYNLPKELEKKLDKLMRELNLNSGSIDLIKGTDNQYYFLEVNPIGQFGMVSYPCNYNIEKEIANYLKS